MRGLFLRKSVRGEERKGDPVRLSGGKRGFFFGGVVEKSEVYDCE